MHCYLGRKNLCLEILFLPAGCSELLANDPIATCRGRFWLKCLVPEKNEDQHFCWKICPFFGMQDRQFTICEKTGQDIQKRARYVATEVLYCVCAKYEVNPRNGATKIFAPKPKKCPK